MHATRVCKSANYYQHCIRKIRNCLSLNICKLLVHSLVTVRLDYGIALLCGARDGVIKQLKRVQRQAARVVCRNIKYDRHTSETELLWGLHWLPIRARIQCKVVLLVYKVFTSSKPPYLSNMLILKKQMRATRSSLKVNLLDIPKTCNNGYNAKAFAAAGPRLWNNILNNELRRCRNLELFKKILGHYCLGPFINCHYCCSSILIYICACFFLFYCVFYVTVLSIIHCNLLLFTHPWLRFTTPDTWCINPTYYYYYYVFVRTSKNTNLQIVINTRIWCTFKTK